MENIQPHSRSGADLLAATRSGNQRGLRLNRQGGKGVQLRALIERRAGWQDSPPRPASAFLAGNAGYQAAMGPDWRFSSGGSGADRAVNRARGFAALSVPCP
jgi:hypothetical protein